MTDQVTVNPTDVDEDLDATEMACPKPVIYAKKMLDKMSSGKILHVVTSDSCSVKNFQAFCKQTRNELLESSRKDGNFHYFIRKA
ncbi:MAG: sulfurtransferase TusA family protein [Gammaproteobacteria bacterium]|nr:MAG: sulfurtransferase TusA family protein [Gammaproteobacteria bacterium]